jgi:DNA polymerase I-like protein with 3'-5' exonuclease and polymerase domains
MEKDKQYKIIRTMNDFEEALSHIELSSYLAYDTETTGLNVRKDMVIGFSFCGEVGRAYYFPLYEYDASSHGLVKINENLDHMKLLKALSLRDLLMWNASFDVRVTKNSLGIDLLGSLLADIQLMKHTVEEDGRFSLKDVAVQYQEEIGLDMEKAANEEQLELKTNVSKNGGSVSKKNFEMYKADLEVLGKYAAADADLTLRLGELFADKLSEEDLEEFFYDKEVMPLYKEVTIPMEDRGIKLDMNLLIKCKKEIEEDISNLENEIVNDIMNTEEAIDWFSDKLSKDFPPSNRGAFAEKYCEFMELDLPRTPSGKFSLASKNIEKLSHKSAKEFLQSGNVSLLRNEDVYLIQKSLQQDSGKPLLNISSKKQMGEIVFNYMDIPPLSKTDKGNPQFNDVMIEDLKSRNIPWAAKLSNYNKLIKIRGAYIDRFLESQEDGTFYPSFFQHRTISGRYGSDLQQLNRPKEEGEVDPIVLKYNNVIRKFFIAGNGRKFIDSDYESLEPHVFAHVSGDHGLKDIFLKGHDFYSTIAIATEKLEGVSADKKADNYLGKINKLLRQAAKAYCLGVPYGMRGFALGKTLGISTEEAEKLINDYLNAFPNLKAWMRNSDEFTKREGYIVSEVGRKRHLSKIPEIYRKYGDDLLDYKKKAAICKRIGKDYALNLYRDYKNGLNNCKNFQIQSLSASIVNMAAVAINKELKERSIDGWVTLQVHDQLVVNVPEDRAEECKELVQSIMENNYKISIPLKAPAEIADNLYEGH